MWEIAVSVSLRREGCCERYWSTCAEKGETSWTVRAELARGRGGTGVVRTGGHVIRTLVCQKSSLSRGGDFFGNHRSDI